MTIWTPRLEADTPTKYQAIADAIESDIENGTLRPGNRLPTLRSVAKQLGVTVGTVGRAYSLAQKRGLVSTQIGRGTFVVDANDEIPSLNSQLRPGTNLGMNLPPPIREPMLAETFASIGQDQPIEEWFEISPVESRNSHREVAAKWMSQRLPTKPSSVYFASGTQNALVTVLGAITKPGDSVLVESLTFPGLLAVAKLLRLTLIPIAMDEEGIIPDSLQQQASHARVLYCIPTNHTATTATQSAKRRVHLARIISDQSLTVIEDDAYGHCIASAPTPLVAELPESGILISSLAKSLLVGLRLAIIRFPDHLRNRLQETLRASQLFPPPLMVEMATRLIKNGVADRIVAARRQSSKERRELAFNILGRERIFGDPQCNHVWLPATEKWSAATFANTLAENGITVFPHHMFSLDERSEPEGVRLALGAPSTLQALNNSLTQIAAQLDRGADSSIGTYY